MGEWQRGAAGADGRRCAPCLPLQPAGSLINLPAPCLSHLPPQTPPAGQRAADTWYTETVRPASVQWRVFTTAGVQAGVPAAQPATVADIRTALGADYAGAIVLGVSVGNNAAGTRAYFTNVQASRGLGAAALRRCRLLPARCWGWCMAAWPRRRLPVAPLPLAPDHPLA